MRFLIRVLTCCVAVAGLCLAVSSTALAQGGGGNSAGNSQYIDPLHHGGHHGHGSGSGSSSSGSSSGPSTSGSSTLSSTAPSGVGTTSSSTQATGRTLPYTGLNLEACVAVGLALLLAGFGLRRVLAAR